jgi:hypothetical protein
MGITELSNGTKTSKGRGTLSGEGGQVVVHEKKEQTCRSVVDICKMAFNSVNTKLHKNKDIKSCGSLDATSTGI